MLIRRQLATSCAGRPLRLGRPSAGRPHELECWRGRKVLASGAGKSQLAPPPPPPAHKPREVREVFALVSFGPTDGAASNLRALPPACFQRLAHNPASGPCQLAGAAPLFTRNTVAEWRRPRALAGPDTRGRQLAWATIARAAIRPPRSAPPRRAPVSAPASLRTSTCNRRRRAGTCVAAPGRPNWNYSAPGRPAIIIMRSSRRIGAPRLRRAVGSLARSLAFSCPGDRRAPIKPRLSRLISWLNNEPNRPEPGPAWPKGAGY